MVGPLGNRNRGARGLLLADFGEDLVGVPLQCAEFLFERLGVGSGRIGIAETNDHIGNTSSFKTLYALGGVGVDADG